MQIKALLVFGPLLLDPVSSLVIPPAQDPCGAIESFARRNDHIQDGLPSGCGQRSEIGHVKPMLFKSQKLEGPSLARPQYHNLNARMPGKKKGGNTTKTGKPTGGNTGTPAGKDTPAEQTKPQGESSGTQPKPNPESPAEKTTPTEKDTSTEKNTPAEQAKPQGEPSGTQSQPQPGNPAQGQKKQELDAQPESLPLRPKPDGESSDSKSETPETQKEPGKEADKDGNQSDDSGEKPGESSDKGKEKASDQGEGEFNDEDDVPLDPKRKNQAGAPTRQKDDERTMYNIVTPNPHEAEGRKNIKTGEQSYFRKVGDGLPDERYSTDNPDFSAVKSHGQEPNVPHSKATKDRPQRLRPGEREEKATTGHDKENEKGETLTEWHKITPKPQDQLEEGQTAWGNEELRQNLINQQKHFKNHKSEDKTDEYGKLTQEMLDMCNTEQCTKTKIPNVQRAIRNQPLLRRRLESLLRERDELVAMATR